VPCQNQLRVALDANKGVRVTDAVVVDLVRPLVPFFLLNELPDFIDLYVFHPQVLDSIRTELLATLSDLGEQFEDGRVMYASQPLNCAEAHSFGEKFEDMRCLLGRQIHAIQGVISCIREHLVALRALIALAIMTLPELPAIDPAIVTSHCESP
jgi:hypothetical protein